MQIIHNRFFFLYIFFIFYFLYICQSLFLSVLCWVLRLQKVLTECIGCALLGRDPRTSSTDSLKQRRNHHLQFEFVLEGQAEWSCQCLAKSLQIWSAVTFTFLHHQEMQALLKDNLSPSRGLSPPGVIVLILGKKKKKKGGAAVESGCSQHLGRETFTNPS